MPMSVKIYLYILTNKRVSICFYCKKILFFIVKVLNTDILLL